MSPRVASALSATRRDGVRWCKDDAGVTWDPSDLVRRVINVLGVAARMLATIDQASSANEPDLNTAQSIEVMLRDKIVAETAMVLLCADRIADRDPHIRQLADALANRLQPLARHKDIISALCLDPGRAWDDSVAHILLSRLGYPDLNLDELLSECLALATDLGPERLPHRQLEQGWLARMRTSAAVSTRNERAILANSMLGRPLDTLGSNRLDIYAFTHSVMYATDFGDRRPRLPRRLANITADADAALAIALDSDDLDLAAEVLLVWPMLRLPWTATAAFGFRLLARVVDELGFLPGATFDSAHYALLSGGAQQRYALTTSYHATYVLGFLCSAALRAGRVSPAVLSSFRRSRGAAAALICLAGAAVSKPCWQKQFDALVPNDQDALAPLVLTAVLRGARARGDLRSVQRALAIALEYDLLYLPATIQAASLLRRGRFVAP